VLGDNPDRVFYTSPGVDEEEDDDDDGSITITGSIPSVPNIRASPYITNNMETYV
jgi:hypothetical protein